jgi:hypothetical protein
MDDGTKDGKTIKLSLYSFNQEELNKFSEFLKNKFDLNFSVRKDGVLYLRRNSIKTFINLVKPYITSDMQYKLPVV